MENNTKESMAPPSTVPAGMVLIRTKDMTKRQHDAVAKDAKVFAKPGCRKCYGRGSLGFAHATVRKVSGRTQVVGQQKVWCDCLMVLIKEK